MKAKDMITALNAFSEEPYTQNLKAHKKEGVGPLFALHLLLFIAQKRTFCARRGAKVLGKDLCVQGVFDGLSRKFPSLTQEYW